MRHNGGFQLAVETFDHAIRLGLIARGAIPYYPELVTQIIPQFWLELRTPICGDSGGSTVACYPPAEEGIGDRFGPNIYNRYGFPANV